MKAAKASGVDDPELLEAIQYYQESEYRHPRRTNKLLFRSYSYILGFDAFSLVPLLLTQPLQVIVGGKQGKTGQFEAGKRLFDLAPSKDKDLFIVEGAGNYDMYFMAEYIDSAMSKLIPFYEKHLH